MSIDFLVHEVGARIVAIVLGIWVGRELWLGLLNRKIIPESSDFVDALLPIRVVFHRDNAPVLYWMVMVLKSGFVLCCVFVAVFGWS